MRPLRANAFQIAPGRDDLFHRGWKHAYRCGRDDHLLRAKLCSPADPASARSAGIPSGISPTRRT